MGERDIGKKVLLFMERYSLKGKELHDSLQREGIDCSVIVLEEDGFLPNGVMSPYEYFILKQNQEFHEEKELHYNFLEMPEFWEARTYGAIYDMGKEKASVYCTEPAVKGTVQRVEWHMEDGWVYRIDHYNKYGLRYASEFFGRDHKVESKVYYSDNHQEVLIEQPQNDTIILCNKSMVKTLFSSYTDFLKYFLDDMGIDGKRIFFLEEENAFWRLGNIQNAKSLWEYIVFSKKELFDKYLEMGGENGLLLYEMTTNDVANQAKGEVLILTASDQIEGMSDLIEKLPNINFHIAANTQVSNKLYDLQKWQNVRVYPQIGAKALENLWEMCDFYLDINYYREIFDAVNQASRNNLLILGFENTLHRRELVIEECILSERDHEGMVRMLAGLGGKNPELVCQLIGKQQAKRRLFWDDFIKKL